MKRSIIKIFSPGLLFVFWYLLCVPVQVWAEACNVIFSNGIQATAANGKIDLSYHSLLTGGGATLGTRNLTDNTAWVACSGSSCVATGAAATSASVTFSTGSGTNGAIAVTGSNSPLSKAAGDYSTVNVAQQTTLIFNTAGGTYKTTAFTTNYQSVVQLQSGDYWINGNLTLAQETLLRRIASSGTTRIFVNGNITMGYRVATQNFSSDQLLIYASGSIIADNEVQLSAYIYAGGNASFNYRSVINGGISAANFTASGNEVTVNYQPSALTTANFAPLCSGAVTAPVLLGSWNMDELSWNGTAGEVKDSSGSGNHGRASVAVAGNNRPSTTSGTPAYTSGSRSTCRYGAFDGTGSPSRAYNYVELSGFPTLPNGFTFAAWIRSTNASAQHQRILVRDDADNGWGLSLADGTGSPELRFFNRNVTNNGAVTGQGVNPNCGVFCVDTNPVIASNTWYYVAAAVDTSAKTVTLYVYNQAGALQAKAVGAYSGTWVDGTGSVAIGGETINSSEGRQSSFHFLGNIDEVNMYSGALPQSSIESLLKTVRTCPAPDHYELEMADTNVTCAGAAVTVRACADSVSPCTNIDYSVNGNVTLDTSAGTLNAGTLALASGVGTTKLLHPSAADGALATVTLSGETTVASNARKCCKGGSCTVNSSCTTTFKTAGFVFSNTSSGAKVNIANQVAGVTGPAFLQALRTNTTTGACMARFSSPQTVKMAYKCVNPNSCINGETLGLNSAPARANANAANPVLYNDVNLSFDANGSAPIPINYSDVGQVQLFASLTLSATGGEPAYTLTGESNTFVVKPHSIKMSAVTNSTGIANPGKTNESGTANGFVSAGAPFKVSVKSFNKDGFVTPNFGKETSSQAKKLTLSANTLVYPVGGTLTGLTYMADSFGPDPINANAFVNPTVAWPQVGSIKIMPGLSDYLNAGSVGGEESSTVGRFYPDHYRVVPASTSVQNGCGNFTYMGQPNIQIQPHIIAEPAGSSTEILTNYDNTTLAYTAGALPVYAAEDQANGTSLSARLLVTNGKWEKGVYKGALTGTFARNNSPDGPFNSLRLGVSAMTNSFDPTGNLTNTAPATGNDMLGASAIAFKDPANASKNLLDMRFGRLRLDNAFGPETVDLPVTFITEYWMGNYFSLSTGDSCTVVPRAAITYPAGTLVSDANRTVTIGSRSTQGIYNNINLVGVSFNAGVAGQKFTAPGAGGTGSFIVKVDLATMPWLRFDWNKDGDFSDTSLPNATIEFGSYRGNDRVIYWREKFQYP